MPSQKTTLFAVAAVMTCTAHALAADNGPPTNAPPSSAASPAPQEDEHADGVRFRGGISAGGGGLFVNNWTAGLAGVDARLGVQLNHYIGIYAQPQLAFGGGSIGRGLTGITGIGAGSAVVDVTLIDRIFIGVGGGGGIIGSAGVGELHFRAGGYPVMGFGESGARRKGLMLGVDMRLFFVSGAVLMSPMLSIGYEAF